MSAFSEFVAPSSVSIATVLLLLRYGPAALVTLVAGVVAALTSHRQKGERALAILTLLHDRPRPARRRTPS